MTLSLIEPIFPFGYGLSYTSFGCDNYQMADAYGPDEAIDIRLQVTNTGDRAGKEVVQLYVQDVASRLIRLCGLFELNETHTAMGMSLEQMPFTSRGC